MCCCMKLYIALAFAGVVSAHRGGEGQGRCMLSSGATWVVESLEDHFELASNFTQVSPRDDAAPAVHNDTRHMLVQDVSKSSFSAAGGELLTPTALVNISNEVQRAPYEHAFFKRMQVRKTWKLRTYPYDLWIKARKPDHPGDSALFGVLLFASYKKVDEPTRFWDCRSDSFMWWADTVERLKLTFGERSPLPEPPGKIVGYTLAEYDIINGVFFLSHIEVSQKHQNQKLAYAMLGMLINGVHTFRDAYGSFPRWAIGTVANNKNAAGLWNSLLLEAIRSVYGSIEQLGAGTEIPAGYCPVEKLVDSLLTKKPKIKEAYDEASKAPIESIFSA